MEKILTVNLKTILRKPTTKRARVAVNTLRAAVARHAKVDESAVKLDNELVSQLVTGGGEKPVHKIKIKIMTDEKGGAMALPPEKKVEQKKAEKPKKETAKPAAKKPEEKKESSEKETAGSEEKKPKFEQKAMEGATK